MTNSIFVLRTGLRIHYAFLLATAGFSPLEFTPVGAEIPGHLLSPIRHKFWYIKDEEYQMYQRLWRI